MAGGSDPYREAVGEFVLLWGEMASAWGINKTMAQIHALLYAEARPLDTDTIMEKLRISRGNASMNLRNLQQWDLVHKVPVEGSRKDYYTAEKEIWKMVSTLIRERQQREIAPIQSSLEQLSLRFESDIPESEEAREFKERIDDFVHFLQMFDRFTHALLPFINTRGIQYLKQIVRLAETWNSMVGRRPEE